MKSDNFVFCLIAAVIFQVFPANLGRSIISQMQDLRKCNFNEVLTRRSSWAFPSNLSCTTEKRKNNLGRWIIFVRCKYNYMCPLDPIGPNRVSYVQCGTSGRWYGKWPDCSDDKLMRYYLSASIMGNPKNLNRKTFAEICRAQRICERIQSKEVCEHLRFNQRTALKWHVQELRSLCKSCYVSFCDQSTKIL